MRCRFWIFVAMIVAALCAFGDSPPDRSAFDVYFRNETLRVDCYHAGDAREEWVTIDQLFLQGNWSGSIIHLIDPHQIGRYCVKIFDAASEKLIFSRSYDTYFGEYRTTDAALRGDKRTFHESVLIPLPKNKIVITFETRDPSNNFRTLLRREIDPVSTRFNRESPCADVKVVEVLESGDPHEKVDMALVAEGYTRDEEAKFAADLERVKEVFFRQEPYRSRRSAFNIRGVFKPSDEGGVDEPARGIFRNTSVQSSFDALGLERYLLTEDNRRLRDITAAVPCDIIVIVANHNRYGGGGIFNSYCIFTADSPLFDYLFLHEFGHAFAGLADEYYTSAVAYNGFYPAGIEPREPNITALLDPANVKWKEWLSPKIPIPTPWGKDEYEKIGREWEKMRQEINQKIALLSKEGKREQEIGKLKGEAQMLPQKREDAFRRFFRNNRSRGKVGVFEGAGYTSKGLFRPMLDCLMFSSGMKPYCRVCEEAIIRTILRYGQ